MVHLRLNEKEVNPNPYINWITSLPTSEGSYPSSDDARELLRALAAQVKPLMKVHGFQVNSFEEYEHNRVFAGRNWNAGETIELVLRRPDGSFYNSNFLLDTLCHELAHIKHMHHAPAFQKLWRQLRSEAEDLQLKGYFGDGFWSSGQRLQDSSQQGGVGVEGTGEIVPEYVCGGAHTQKKKGYLRARRPRRSNNTQTSRKRKPGSRMTKALPGEGIKLNEEGGSKGKQANSKRARVERALAAERRLATLKGKEPEISATDGPDEDSEGVFEPEDDDSRRLTMQEVMSGPELEQLRIVAPNSMAASSSRSSGAKSFYPQKILGKRAQIRDSDGANRQVPAKKANKLGIGDNISEEKPTFLRDWFLCMGVQDMHFVGWGYCRVVFLDETY
ncbi:hypothetical protein FRB99_003176 [Tulasnella sp. 403]|nr:hypothetical protein FRB99_003176 [Tulasnella sp. 403]